MLDIEVFLTSKKNLNLGYFPRNQHLLSGIDDHIEVQQLKEFSQGYYTVEKWSDTLVFNDLRFGQIIGWEEPTEKFVFHYFLSHPEDNKLVVQRGRFARWNRSTPRPIAEEDKGKLTLPKIKSKEEEYQPHNFIRSILHNTLKEIEICFIS